MLPVVVASLLYIQPLAPHERLNARVGQINRMSGELVVRAKLNLEWAVREIENEEKKGIPDPLYYELLLTVRRVDTKTVERMGKPLRPVAPFPRP